MFWGAFSFGMRTALAPMFGDPLSKRGGVSSRMLLETLKEHLLTICLLGFIFI